MERSDLRGLLSHLWKQAPAVTERYPYGTLRSSRATKIRKNTSTGKPSRAFSSRTPRQMAIRVYFCSVNSAAFQPPPNARINPTAAVSRRPSKLTAVRSLDNCDACTVTTFK